MKVYVVYSEFNRGADVDGAADINGVYATKTGAEAHAEHVRMTYREELRYSIYGDDEDDDAEWDVDVRVREEEVQE